jgi:hypothetical protein
MAERGGKSQAAEPNNFYRFGGNYKKGTRPTLLESVEAIKVVRFIENMVFRSTANIFTGGPKRNYFRVDFRNDGKVDFWLGVQTDLIFDPDPTLASNLKLNGQDIFANLAGSKFIQNANEGLLISGQSGFPGSIFLQCDPANGTNSVGFISPATVPASVVWTLPAADGTASQFLQTDGAGVLTWAAGGGGGVTEILTGTGLTGGPITTTGTVSMANTAVTPGTYGTTTAVSEITVDAQGRLTAANNVAISFPTVSSVATTGTIDVVQSGAVYSPHLKGLSGVSLVGKAGMYLRVLGNETGFEFVTMPNSCDPIAPETDVYVFHATIENNSMDACTVEASTNSNTSTGVAINPFAEATIEGHTDIDQPAVIGGATLFDILTNFDPVNGQTFEVNRTSGAGLFDTVSWGISRYTFDGVTYTGPFDTVVFDNFGSVDYCEFAWVPV